MYSVHCDKNYKVNFFPLSDAVGVADPESDPLLTRGFENLNPFRMPNHEQDCNKLHKVI
jgi:hypothetical protein